MRRSFLVCVLGCALFSCTGEKQQTNACVDKADCPGEAECIEGTCVLVVESDAQVDTQTGQDTATAQDTEEPGDTEPELDIAVDTASAQDTSAQDTSAPDTSAQDTAMPDTSAQDTAMPDTQTGTDTAVADTAQDTTPPGPTLCPQLPPGATRQLKMTYNEGGGSNMQAETLEELFGPWPLTPANEGKVYRGRIRQAQFVSLPFTIPASTPSNQGLNLAWEATVNSSDGVVVSVSECIGGILPSQATESLGTGPVHTCHRQGTASGGGLRIGTDPVQANCVLETGKTYFLNVMDYDAGTGADTCSANDPISGNPRTYCTWLVRPTDF